MFEWISTQPTSTSGEIVTVHRSDGDLDVFQATSASAPDYRAQDGKREGLKFIEAPANALDTYRLTLEDGTVHVFEKAVLRSIEPPGAPSLAHEICYADSLLPTFPATPTCLCGAAFANITGGQLVPCKLVPSAGPAVVLSWLKTAAGNPVVKSLNWGSASGEEVATYEYDLAAGDLLRARSVKSPGVYETTQYLYDGDHHLKQVTDPANFIAESLTWDAGRAISETTPTHLYRVTYVSANQTILSEPDAGTSYTLGFAGKSEPTSITSGCSCNTNVAGYTWSNKNLQAIQYADGTTFVSYQLNDAGDPVRVVRGDNDAIASTVPAGAISEDFTYHPGFRARTSLSRQALSSPDAGSTYTIYDYQDPFLTPAPTDPFCGTNACATPDKFNLTSNLSGLLWREIRKGTTLSVDGTFTPEPVTYSRFFDHDAQGRLSSSFYEGPGGEQTNFEYFPPGAAPGVANRLRFVRRVLDAPAAHLVTEIIGYDNRGNPTQLVDESGQTWLFTYERDRVKTSLIPGVTSAAVFDYGLDGRLDFVTLPAGNVIRYTYDAKRQLTGMARVASKLLTSPTFERVQFDLDPARGLVLEERSFRTPPGGTEVEYRHVGFVYDNLGRQVATKVYRGDTTTAAFLTLRQYDLLGNVGQTKDANHTASATFTSQFAYNPSAFLKTVKRLVSGSLHTDTTLAPDAHDNVASVTDGEGRVTTYGYDDFDRVISVDGPRSLRFAYDAMGRLVRRSDDVSPFEMAPTSAFPHQYDLAGRPVAINFGSPSSNPLDNPETWMYDEPDETLVKCVGGAAPTLATATLKNRQGRLSTHQRVDYRASTAVDPVDEPIELKYGYDAVGRIAVEARRVGMAEQCWHVIERSYSPNGRLQTLTYPSGRVVTYMYPAAPSATQDVDRPTSITSTLPGGTALTVVSGIEYEGEEPVKWTSANGVVTTVRSNLDGTEASRRAVSGVTAFLDETVSGRDGNGNLTQLKNSAGVIQTQDFTYTDRNELASADLLGAGAYGSLAYTYNNAGDRLTATRDGATTTYAYRNFRLESLDAGATYTRQYVYDDTTRSLPRTVVEDNPAQSTDLPYYRDGLLALNGSTLDGYDALHRRASRALPLNQLFTQEFWGADGKLLSELGYKLLNAPDPRPVFDYVWLGNERVALLTGTWDSTGVGVAPLAVAGPPLIDDKMYALHGNHVGATVKATDATQTVVFSAEYEPFGRAVTSGPLQLQTRLPGQYETPPSVGVDRFSALYNRNRSLDPSTGMFPQAEPLLRSPAYMRAMAALGMPVNTYVYAANNPLRFTDSSGMDIAVIENGPTSGNPFGHTAIAITGEGVFSFGTTTRTGALTPLGNYPLTEYILDQVTRRDTMITLIKTTAMQDAAATRFIRSLSGKPLGLVRDNCASRSNGALDAAGVSQLAGAPYSAPGSPGQRVRPHADAILFISKDFDLDSSAAYYAPFLQFDQSVVP